MDKLIQKKEADVQRLTTKAVETVAGKREMTPASADAALEITEAFWRQRQVNRRTGGSSPKYHSGLQALTNSIVAEHIGRNGIPPTLEDICDALESLDEGLTDGASSQEDERLDEVYIDGNMICWTTRTGKEGSITKKTLYGYRKRALETDSG